MFTGRSGLYADVPFAEDGSALTNPPGTLQAVTSSALLPGQGGCPQDTNCFVVQVTNFTGRGLDDVFMGIDSIVSPTGRSLIGSDATPAFVTAPLGGKSFGGLNDGETSAAVAVNIAIPDTSAYTVNGRFWGDAPTSIVLQCGGSNLDLTPTLPPGFTLVQDCTPSPDAQAIIVSRCGADDMFNECGSTNPFFANSAASYQAYVQSGGILITEFGASDDVYNTVFGTSIADNDGLVFGGCNDAIMPETQASAGDLFWQENAFGGADGTACGSVDVSTFPGVTLLGSVGGVGMLGYRDLGAGRVWAVEADWFDGGQNVAQNQALLGYMVTHR